MNKHPFDPYIGDFYNDGLNKIRTLVIGDSHYCTHENCIYRAECMANCRNIKQCPESEGGDIISQMNIDNIGYYLYNSKKYKVFFRLTNIFLGIKNTGRNSKEEEAKKNIWNHLAFLNYTPQILPNHENKYFDYSEDNFNIILNTISSIKLSPPHLIICLGNKVRGGFTENMARKNKHLQPIAGNRGREWLFRGEINEVETIICVLTHPSWKAYSEKTHIKNIEKLNLAIEKCLEGRKYE
jgi:hypothetical protein